MKRIFIYGLLLAVALAAPAKRNDLGKLHPVELIKAHRENGAVVLETDTGAKGKGKDIASAIQNLKDTTAGIVFLDTADYLLVGYGEDDLIAELKDYLKRNTRICFATQTVDPEEATGFMSVHTPQKRIGQWKMGDKVGKLEYYDGRLCLNEK